MASSNATGKWTADPAGVYFSDRFRVSPDVLDKYGAFDISVVSDLPLFIDPFLLFNSRKRKYQALHESIIEYLRFLKSKANANLTKGLINGWYRFPEVRQNWLGFVEGGNAGHGLGRGFAADLNAALVSLLPDFGSETVTESTHLEKLALIRSGVGRDTISDFTTNLIKHFLCDYTQMFTRKYIDEDLSRDFVVGRVAFNRQTETWMSGTYRLPNLDGDFVLLTPKDLLTRDDTWINHTDMVYSFHQLLTAVDDAQLRAQVQNYLARRLSQDPIPKELKEAQARTIREFPILVDLYIKAKEDDRDEASSVSAERTADTRSVLVSQVQAAAADIATKTTIYTEPWSSYDEAREAAAVFKHYVEHQDGYKLINRGDGKPFASEKEVQTFFGLLLARSRFDVNREPNNGRGPVDFKISSRAHDKALIEFKLAKSSSLKRNLQKQVEIYKIANKTPNAMKVVIAYTAAEMEKVDRVLDELDLAGDASIVIVDARSDNKPSASVA
jgi:hypothetical protein